MIFLPSKPSAIKQPKLNERRVFDFLKMQTEPVSYHKMHKSLDMTTGALQATIERCLKSHSTFRIYEGKKISKQNDRLIRVFSVSQSKISNLNIPDIADLHEIYQNVIAGNIFQLENNYILPLSMDEQTTKILMQLVKISPNHKSIGDLFSQAMMKYLKESISKDKIDQAIQNLNEIRKLEENRTK